MGGVGVAQEGERSALGDDRLPLVISSSASSQVIGLNWPEPFGPVRRSGVLMRSGELTRSASRLTFPQANPAVYGMVWIALATP